MAKRISNCIRNCDELRALADRIDSEMVELPKDADDVPIHVGDTVWGCRSHVKMTIAALRIEDSGLAVYVDGGTCRVDALDVSHNRPDSWERIAYDIETIVPIDDEGDERLRHELADRIRRLAKKEDKQCQ